MCSKHTATYMHPPYFSVFFRRIIALSSIDIIISVMSHYSYIILPLSVYAEVHSRHCCITPPPAFDPLDIFESEERFGGIFRAVEDDGTTKPHTEVKSKTHTKKE